MTSTGLRAGGVAVLLSAGLVVAGCGGGNEGGTGLPTPRPGESYPGPTAQVSGTIVDDRGCFLLESAGIKRLVVWPSGTDQDRDDASVLSLPGGTQLRPGDTVSGAGAVVPVTALAGYPEGYWGQQVGFCTPDATEVLVLASAARG